MEQFVFCCRIFLIEMGNLFSKWMTRSAEGQVTQRQIVRLAAAISADKMAAIAEGYLGISDETIKNTERDTRNSEAFNREILKYWINKNPGPSQVKVGN